MAARMSSEASESPCVTAASNARRKAAGKTRPDRKAPDWDACERYDGNCCERDSALPEVVNLSSTSEYDKPSGTAC